MDVPIDNSAVVIAGIVGFILFLLTVSLGAVIFLNLQNSTQTQYGTVSVILTCTQINGTQEYGCWTQANTTPAVSLGNWTNVNFIQDGEILTMGICNNETIPA